MAWGIALTLVKRKAKKMGFFHSKSLMVKLIVAFCGVSIMGIAIIGLTAAIASRIEFYRFMSEISYSELVQDLSYYHSQNGSFVGAESLLDSVTVDSNSQAHEFFIADRSGNILIASTGSPKPGLPNTNLTMMGLPIKVDGITVAYLIPLRPPALPYGDVGRNVQRVNKYLWQGMLAAAFAALCVGWFISHKIIIPIRQLNTATHLVAAGDLETTVNVKNKDEIGQLADAFNQMTNSLRKDRDLRQQMTADIAHELRNPLTIIMGNAEAISEGILPPTKEAMEVIYDEAKHLSVLVDDLRTLSLSEAGELNLQKSLVNLKELFDRLALSFALKVAEKQATLSFEVASDVPLLLADAGRLSQIFSNLLNNSVKHIDASGKVVVSAALVKGPNGEELVQIDVADNGAGIPADDLPFIFDRFYRARNRTNRLLDGTGLGLAISRSLVENHGGTIRVVSEPGKRTVFSVTLPVGDGGSLTKDS